MFSRVAKTLLQKKMQIICTFVSLTLGFFDWFSNIDIAILKLEKEALPSSKVGYICLPASSSFVDFTGIELTTSGWGDTSFQGNGSDVLKVATVYGVSNEECKEKLKKMKKVTKTMLCADKEQTDACNGDSGGKMCDN